MILKLIFFHCSYGRNIRKELEIMDFGTRITHGDLSEFEKENDERKDRLGTIACQLVHDWAIKVLKRTIMDDEHKDISKDIEIVLTKKDDINVEWKDFSRYQKDIDSKFIVYSHQLGNPIGEASIHTEIYAVEKLD